MLSSVRSSECGLQMVLSPAEAQSFVLWLTAARRRCCVDRSGCALRRLVSRFGSDHVCEFIESCRHAQTLVAGFDSEFVVAASQVLDECVTVDDN